MKRRRKIRRTRRRGSKRIRLLDLFLKVSFIGFLGVVLISIFFAFQVPKLEAESMMKPKDSKVYDKNNQYIGVVSRKPENQINIKYSDLNQGIINSLVGTEDGNFFTHHGVDLLNTIDNGFRSIILKREDSGGGSSITQQIIGHTHLDRNERSISRKIKEIILSLEVEKRLNKDQILELYLNYFWYGRNDVSGIERASNYFFNKKATDLDYVQAALLTGTLNSPVTYNPLGDYNDKTKTFTNHSKERLDIVLLSNLNQGYISPREYYLLQQVKVQNEVDVANIETSNKYVGYLDAVREEMEEKYHIDLNKKSYKIYTSLDQKAQRLADEVASGRNRALAPPAKYLNYGFVLSRTQTGEISAIGGGTQYKNGGMMQFNNATKGAQQPGSAFKPIIDYSPSFEFLHWGDRTPISNAAWSYPGTNMKVGNADGIIGGVLTMDQALATSKNLTALRTLQAVTNKIGIEGVNAYLRRLGFDFNDNEINLSYGIGGTDKGVTPLQMNGAYQAFGNGGKYIKPFTIRSFTDTKGNNEIKNPTKPVQAMDPRTAFLMSTALERSTKISGLLRTANYYATPYAAKTGTTDWGTGGLQYGIPKGAQRDSWYTGYTSEYTMSVWIGFDLKGIQKGKYPQYGAQHDYSGTLWGAMMNQMVTGKETSWLNAPLPEGIVKRNFDASVAVNLDDPHSIKAPNPFSKTLSGYFYTDNLPSGMAPNAIDTEKYNVSISSGMGSITVRFDSVDKDDVRYVVSIDGQRYAGHPGLNTYPIRDMQSVNAYYAYNDKNFGDVSGYYYNGKIYGSFDEASRAKDANEGQNSHDNFWSRWLNSVIQ
jgi:penicillin-binding protein 1A